MAILKLISKFSRWCSGLFGRWRVIGYVEAADEVPEHLMPRGVMLVGVPSNWTWVAMECPCGVNHRIMLNLNPERHPNWRITSLKPLSIRPSVLSINNDRQCHFFLLKGRVRWAGKHRRRGR